MVTAAAVFVQYLFKYVCVCVYTHSDYLDCVWVQSAHNQVNWLSRSIRTLRTGSCLRPVLIEVRKKMWLYTSILNYLIFFFVGMGVFMICWMCTHISFDIIKGAVWPYKRKSSLGWEYHASGQMIIILVGIYLRGGVLILISLQCVILTFILPHNLTLSHCQWVKLTFERIYLYLNKTCHILLWPLRKIGWVVKIQCYSVYLFCLNFQIFHRSG